jgi:hypothetical protein
MQRAHGSSEPASLALNLRVCYFGNKDLLKETRGSIAV